MSPLSGTTPWVFGVIALAVALALIARRHARAAATPTTASWVPGAGPSPGTASHVRVFASGMCQGSLPASLSIETLRGVSAVLVPRGTALPFERREAFSTSADDMASIEVHVLVGEATRAADNVTVAKFTISEVRSAARAVPRIDVTFTMDAHGTFGVSASDRETGRALRVSAAHALSMPLSRIDR